ncbi:hypothetical protein [Frankia sp. CiP3]|uniref:hypothetical protein n=1 Tax=Frankia sp. CiP3 TaxID=2880971 RepID=UPI001EF52AAD|nr:hypothetical protein [Frankia sp. CiP3]
MSRLPGKRARPVLRGPRRSNTPGLPDEQWFGVLTRRLLRRGDFASRDDLEQQIIDFTPNHNATATPYQWRYDAAAEHAHYLDRHPAGQPEPATDALPTAA